MLFQIVEKFIACDFTICRDKFADFFAEIRLLAMRPMAANFSFYAHPNLNFGCERQSSSVWGKHNVRFSLRLVFRPHTLCGVMFPCRKSRMFWSRRRDNLARTQDCKRVRRVRVFREVVSYLLIYLLASGNSDDSH